MHVCPSPSNDNHKYSNVFVHATLCLSLTPLCLNSDGSNSTERNAQRYRADRELAAVFTASTHVLTVPISLCRLRSERATIAIPALPHPLPGPVAAIPAAAATAAQGSGRQVFLSAATPQSFPPPAPQERVTAMETERAGADTPSTRLSILPRPPQPDT